MQAVVVHSRDINAMFRKLGVAGATNIRIVVGVPGIDQSRSTIDGVGLRLSVHYYNEAKAAYEAACSAADPGSDDEVAAAVPAWDELDLASRVRVVSVRLRASRRCLSQWCVHVGVCVCACVCSCVFVCEAGGSDLRCHRC